MIHHYQHGDETYSLRLEPEGDGVYTAIMGEQVLRLRATRTLDGAWRLEPLGTDERSPVVAATARAGKNRYVHLRGADYPHGQTYTLSVTDPAARRRRNRQAGGSAHITAQMPGQVVDVLVAPGDTVATGQLLLILEAMKMEIRVSAPHAGRVRQALVSKGDVVEKDQTLIDLDAGEDGDTDQG